MFGDERLGVGRGTHEGGKIGFRSDISQSDADVSEETASFDPFDRRTAEEFSKLRVVEGKKIPERPSGDGRSCGESALA